MQSETTRYTEAPRRSIKEVDPQLIQDLREYETYKDDKIRDMHITYARSVIKNITEGMSLERVVEIVCVEAVYKSLDTEKLYGLLNYLSNESGLAIQFDARMNIYKDGELVVHSGVTNEALEELTMHRSEQASQTAMRLAKEAATRLLSGFSVDVLMVIIKADLVSDDLDSALVARYINDELIQAGSPLRFNQYLEQVDI